MPIARMIHPIGLAARGQRVASRRAGRMPQGLGLGLLGLLGLLSLAVPAAGQPELPLDEVTLPPGFHIDIYADGLTNPRSMVRSPSGSIFVGTRAGVGAIARGAQPNAGRVYALRDRDGDQQADETIQLAIGLNAPNGVAWHDGDLYVAEIDRVLRFDDIEARLDDPPAPVVVSDAFPSDWMHGWKYIAFGPDGKLYVPVGAPCNVCDHSDTEPIYSSITRMDPDGSNQEVFVHGVRNSVGFDWHPVTGALWFTSNGRDLLGDETPPDTLNHAPRADMHFGFPYCHGGDIPDPEFGAVRPCGEFEPPARNLGPHVAALGMRFYDGDMFPDTYRHRVFVAEHGSWNRSQDAGHTGYRITTATLDGASRVVEYEVFADGWLRADNQAWGRPVDLLVMPDGALLVSDDQANVIYRIHFED